MPTSPRIMLYLRALRAFSFPLSGLPVLVGVASCLPLRAWSWSVLVAELAGAVLLHAVGNLLNDYHDYLANADVRVHDDEGRPGRFLVRGELTPGAILGEVGVCLLLFVPCLLYVLLRAGPGLLVFGAIGLLGAWAYTAPPLRLKHRALGELTILAVFGPALVTGAAYAQTRHWEWAALACSFAPGLATTAVLAGNNLRDIEEDGQAGVRTLARWLGARGQARLYVGLLLASALSATAVGLVGGLHRPWLLAMVPAPALLLPLRSTFQAAAAGTRIPDIDVRTAQFGTMLSVLMLMALLLAGGLT